MNRAATSLALQTRSTLTQAAPLLMFAIMAVLIVCGGVYGFNAYQASERERHGAELLARVEVQAGHVGSWVTERHQDAHSTAVDPMLSAAFGAALRDPVHAAPLRDRLAELGQIYGYHAALLVDRTGQVVAGYGDTELEGDEQRLLGLALTSGDATVSAVYDSQHTAVPHPHVSVAHAVRDATGTATLGALVLRMDAAHALPYREADGPGPGGRGEILYMYAHEGQPRYINTPFDPVLWRAEAHQPGRIEAQAHAGTRGLYEGVDYRDQQVLAAARPVPGTDWIALGKMTTQTVYAQSREAAVHIAVLTALLLVATALFMRNWRNQRTARLRLRHLEAQRSLQQKELALAKANTSLELAARAASIAFWEWDLTSNDIHFSAEWMRMLGLQGGASTVSLADWFERCHPEDYARLLAEAPHWFEQDEKSFHTEFRMRHAEGGWRWMLSQGAVVCDAAGTPVRVYGCNLDITERKDTEHELRMQARHDEALAQIGDYALRDRRVATVMQHVAERMASVLHATRVGVFEYADAEDVLRLVAGFGFTSAAMRRHGRLHAQDGTLRELLAGGAPIIVDGRLCNCPFVVEDVLGPQSLGSLIGVVIEGREGPWGLLTVDSPRLSAFGEAELRFAQAAAHTLASAVQRSDVEERLRYLAHHDDLTGLPNRVAVMERLSAALALAKREQHQVAVLMLDLDRFKLINDTLGHRAGDALLRAVATRLRNSVRATDVVARVGGDEFVLVLQAVSGAQGLASLSAALLAELEQPLDIHGSEVRVSGSLGISIAPNDANEGEVLMRQADLAMYEAKNNGKNTFRFFTEALNDEVQARMVVESGLRRALQHNEFLVHYQPNVCLRTGRIVGVEALVRWQHPHLGMISPADFIPVAEETGLIRPIGEWVIREAVTRMRDLAQHEHLSLAVNLSARQFKGDDLVKLIGDLLEETGFPAHQLTLELTESAVMDDAEGATITFGRLKELGVRIALDDFGTGYSSLSYLRRFPIDVLKIDRAFVQRLPDEPEDAAIVRALIALSRALDVKVVAEGVENEQQRDALHDAGCDFGQGYYFSRPLAWEVFVALLAEHKKARSDAA